MNLLEVLDFTVLNIPTLRTLDVSYNRISKIVTQRGVKQRPEPSMLVLAKFDISICRVNLGHNSLAVLELESTDLPSLFFFQLGWNAELSTLDLSSFDKLISIDFSTKFCKVGYCQLTSLVMDGTKPQLTELIGNFTRLTALDLQNLNAPYLSTINFAYGMLTAVRLPESGTPRLLKVNFSNAHE